MRKTDINKFTGEAEQQKAVTTSAAVKGAKRALSIVWKLLSTFLMILCVSFVVVGISVLIYLFGLANEPTGIDLHASKLQLTSFIYVNDENGNPVEYQRLHSTENRIWVDYENIPQAMKDAIIAIEDKRFYDHNGVDWVRTAGAVFSLASGSDSYGGSTLTQQLIKNITDDNQVSITRKLREIFRALNLERDFTKDEILEAYLNIVNFGSGCRGVQAAAHLYFGKDIQDCSIAQCAAIAGITQNPAAYTPLDYPESNKERRETVLQEMYDQGKINKEEYDQAMKESQTMTFVGYVEEEEDEEEEEEVPNWYIDMLFRDLRTDLAQELNISEDAASTKLYTEGLKIYCAMDTKMQEFAEQYVLNLNTPSDPNLQMGLIMMDFDGRIIASVGSREKKDGMLLWDRANISELQPGSSIKPSFVYPLAIENKIYHFSSFVLDEPIEHWAWTEDGWISGPNNSGGYYYGNVLLPDAIEASLNGAAVQTMQLVGVKNAYNQAVNKTGFRHLTTEDSENIGGLSIGGLNGGVTVREMVASYQYMGNGGKYYEPYSYYYVTDQDGDIILDNRENIPIQSYSAETATIMNRLLHYNVTYSNPAHTAAGMAAISGWDILGKTGTTDYGKDHWFIGLSPHALLGIWTGFDTPASIVGSTNVAEQTFHDLMSEYLSDKEAKEFTLSPNVEAIPYCASTGLLATSYCGETYMGYYTEDMRPDYCYGGHGYSYYDDSYDDYDDYDDDYDSSYSYDDSSDVSSDDASSEPDYSDVPSEDPGSVAPEPPASSDDVPPAESGGDVSTGGDVTSGEYI